MEETTTAITAVKQEIQLRDWAAQIAAQQASEMTVQKWCAENGVKPKTYCKTSIYLTHTIQLSICHVK